MRIAGTAASRRGIPIVLDPVGAGATSQRTAAVVELIELCRPTIIRGNGSEIMTVASAWSKHLGSSEQEGTESAKSKGVDSSASSDDAIHAAIRLAQQTGAVVVISGATDYITDGKLIHTVEGGDKIMTAVTGMGCTSTALVGAFAAVIEDPLFAATAAMAVMSLAGERAEDPSLRSG